MISDDYYFMTVALNHARRGLGFTAPNPSVGCVIVKDGRIVAAASTAPSGGRPHAETVALAQAGIDAKGACAYVTLEPCAHHGQTGPCAQALIDAGIRRVVVACIDPDLRVSGRGIKMLQDAGIEVVQGALEREARELNRGFFLKISQHRPLVTLKIAVSADQKISAAKGQRTQISGDLANRYMHVLRSQHDAVLVGIGTVLVDNSLLTARVEGQKKVMTRIVLDHRLEIPLESALVQGAKSDPVLVFYNQGSVDKIEDLLRKGCELIPQDPHDLKAVLGILAERGITRLLVEGGAKIHTAFLKFGLVDEFQLIRSPKILGAYGVPALGGYDLAVLEADFGLKLQKTRNLGEDLLEFYRSSA
jgi:diaminohydroxyphosphoribosylaminopyrimidine deaminase/5-amino-6-(5-phosphoribosylamino)uracil reductase